MTENIKFREICTNCWFEKVVNIRGSREWTELNNDLGCELGNGKINYNVSNKRRELLRIKWMTKKSRKYRQNELNDIPEVNDWWQH